MNAAKAALLEHPFLRGLRPEQAEAVAALGIRTRFEPGELLLKEGEEAAYLYLIESGRVGVELPSGKGGTVQVDAVGSGQLLGWSWLLPPHRWRFDARAVEATEALAVPAKRLRDLLLEDHELGFQLALRLTETVTRRLESARRRIKELAEGRRP